MFAVLASFEMLERVPANMRETTRRRRAALVRIFAYLDVTSLCRASQVCREWRLVCRSPNLWKVVKVTSMSISEQVSDNLSKSFQMMYLRSLCRPRPRVHKTLNGGLSKPRSNTYKYMYIFNIILTIS